MNITRYIRRFISSNFKKFKEGDTTSIKLTITQNDVDKFSLVTGDHNPIHKGPNAIIHGALLNGIISGIIGTKLPGPGCVVVSQSFNFPNKSHIDKEIEFNVTLVEARKILKVVYVCKQDDKVVFEGDAKLVFLSKL